MDLLNKLTIKNLLLNKKRTIVTIIGIILSVALISAVASMFFSFRDSMISYEKKYKGNFHTAIYDVNKEDIKTIKLNTKIEDLYLVKNLGYAKVAEIRNEYKPYVYIKALNKDGLTNLGLNLITGRLPENSQEIVIPNHLQTNGKVKLEVGSTITLDVGKRIDVSDGKELTQLNPFNTDISEDIIDSKSYTYKIVGIIERPSSIIESYEAPGYSLFTYLENEDNSNCDVFIKYNKKGLKDVYKITANIIGANPTIYERLYKDIGNISEEEYNEAITEINKAKYKVNYNSYLITLETGVVNDNTLKALGSACIIVVIIIIFTSVFCIKNSFDISITEKTREYGMLASVGATKKQIKKNVYYEALILGVIAIPLGILSGLLASYILIIISDYLLKEMEISGIELHFSFSLIAILLAILLGFITIFLSARKSAKRASKTSPIMAIRNNEDIKIKRNKIKAPKIITKLFGIGGEISYKNLKRSKRKYRTTVISIIICSSVFIGLSAFISIIYKTIQLDMSTVNYDLSFNYQNDIENITDKMTAVKNLENIEEFTEMASTGLKIIHEVEIYSKEYLELHQNEQMVNYTGYQDEDGYYHDNINLRVLDNASFRRYVKELGLNYNDVKDEGILINRIYERQDVGNNKTKEYEVNKYNYQAGNVIKGEIYNGEENMPISFKISKVAIKTPLGISNHSYYNYLILDENYFNNIPIIFHEVYLNSNNPTKLQEDIENIFEDDHLNVENVAEIVHQIKSLILLVSIFLYGFITVIALIGITNIFNTITTNMNLRRREFAMLKSIGMTNKEFKKMIRLESLFYGTKSLLIGIPLGIIISYLIHKAVNVGDYVLNYELPSLAIIITCLVVFLLIFIIMQYSISKINKQNIIETIRNENI